jgi:DNA modification methylase
MKRWEILEGDVRAVLKTVPDDHIHCIITSPPYYGMRNYGTDPQIWGGNPDCNHEWGGGINIKRDGGVQKDEDGYGASRRVDVQSYFCVKCDAWKGELGLEPTPGLFVKHLVDIFMEAGRVLRDDGVLWVNIGDGYSDGKDLKPMDLMGIPWMFAFAMRDAGFFLRSDTIWAKGCSLSDKYSGSCGTESVNGWRWERHRVRINKDDKELTPCPGCERCEPNNGYVLRKGSWRPTKGHEYMFMFTQSEDYFCDIDAVRENYVMDHARESIFAGSPKYADDSFCVDAKNQTRNMKGNVRYAHSGRNIRSVWLINPGQYPNAHCATFPPALPEPCIKVSASEKGCCPECGSPWVRVIEKGDADEAWKKRCGADSGGGYKGHGLKDYSGAGAENPSEVKARILRNMKKRLTSDWWPSCDCGMDSPVPCTVMDIFSGSGSTGVAAIRNNRNYIGIELNREFAELSRDRLRSVPGSMSRRLDDWL